MKKILFVINTLGRAGAETALLELLRRLDAEEYEISLYVLLGQGEMISSWCIQKIRIIENTFIWIRFINFNRAEKTDTDIFSGVFPPWSHHKENAICDTKFFPNEKNWKHSAGQAALACNFGWSRPIFGNLRSGGCLPGRRFYIFCP